MSESESAAKFFGQIIEKAGEAVIIASNDGTILEWNASAERIFGWSKAQAMGQNIDMLIPDNQKDAHWTGYDQVLESGKTQFADGNLLTVSALKADGSHLGVEMSMVALEEGGQTTAIAVIVRPVRHARPAAR